MIGRTRPRLVARPKVVERIRLWGDFSPVDAGSGRSRASRLKSWRSFEGGKFSANGGALPVFDDVRNSWRTGDERGKNIRPRLLHEHDLCEGLPWLKGPANKQHDGRELFALWHYWAEGQCLATGGTTAKAGLLRRIRCMAQIPATIVSTKDILQPAERTTFLR